MIPVILTDYAQNDFNNLDKSQQIQIAKSIHKLETHGYMIGEPLSGPLRGYRKLKHKKLGLRVVFHKTNKGIEIIEIIAIGKRSDSDVYKIATKRIDNK